MHPLIADSFLRLDEAETVRDLFWPGSFENDSQMFPWKTKKARVVNWVMAWFWGHTYGVFVLSFLFRWFFILFNYLLVLGYFIKRVLTVLILKKKVMQKVLPINLPEDKFQDKDYEKLLEDMKPLEELVEALPRNSRSSHTFVDDAILYCHEREVDYPFDDFVSKVDICRAVTTMKDYVGGRTIQKKSDNGRCIHQLERTVFLPQPNLLVLANGKDIDVTKIERIDYGTGFQKLFWKTVLSDNGTGVYDEGTVTLEQHNFKTRIRIMAHQKFLYPWALKWAQRMDLWPVLRRFIMLRIYRGFFEKTIDNYCALAEGKYKPIGEPWKTSTEDP